MSTSYYGGDGADLGNVHQLPQTTFDAFVKEVLGHPALLNTTRDQFWALPKKERDRKKRVPYVTPATFSQGTSPRNYEHARPCNLIAVDIDSSEQARPFVADPRRIADALEPYAFAAYTTASSKPEAPRLRVFVSAHNISLADYPRAAAYIATLLGLPSVTYESKVSVQPMFLPTMFAGDDALTDHPLIISRTGEAPALTSVPEDVSVVPSAGRASSSPAGLANADELAFLRAPVETVTVEDAAEALSSLDPDCGYGEWLEIAAALRHQFPHNPDAAYEAFDAWSAKGEKYGGQEDTLAKWRSLRPTPRGRAPVTIRTLLVRAQAAGWKGVASITAKAYQEVWTWLSTARTAQELLGEGVTRIAAAPLLSGVERAALLSKLGQAFKAAGIGMTPTDLKRELRKLEKRSASRRDDAIKSTPDAQLPAWARGMCYVAGANEFYQRSSDKKLNPEVLDNVFGVHLMNGSENESGRPLVRPRDWLLNVAKIPRVDHYRYDPASPDTFITEGRQRWVNIYLPTYPEPDADDADVAGEILSRHVDNLVKEDEYRKILLSWLAYHVQQPGRKIRWAVLLQGAQGCGKTALAEMMSGVLGASNLLVMDASQLFSQFNEWAAGHQLVAMEEIRIVGHNRHEVMNRLKPCMSNNTVSINRKGKSLQKTVNNTNYIMFTNHHDSLAVTGEDRRYFVLNSALQSREQVRALGPEYFNNLFTTFSNRAAGLRSFLEQYKLSPKFDPDAGAVITPYFRDLTGTAASPLTAAVGEAIADGEHPLVKYDLVSNKALKSILSSDSLPRFTEQSMASALRELAYEPAGRVRLDDGRHSLWTKQGATAFADPAATARQRMQGTFVGADGGVLDDPLL